MKFSVYQRSEKGGRKTNEDRMGYTYTRESALFVLTDGMGGHAHGELAAQITLEVLTTCFQAKALPKIAEPKAFLAQSLLSAHHRILQFGLEHSLGDSPRTTALALLVQDGQAWSAHCGDSRLYWIRDGELLRRTRDHSYVEQTPSGMMPSKDASASYLAKMANRNILFTCLGSPTKPLLDISEASRLVHGDRFLLCSDGIWSNFTDTELVGFFNSDTIAECTSFLIDLSLKRGGLNSDNATAMGISWEDNKVRASSNANLVTDTLIQDSFASTVQNQLVDSDMSKLIQTEDFDLEDSLKEINAAIQKYNNAHKPQ